MPNIFHLFPTPPDIDLKNSIFPHYTARLKGKIEFFKSMSGGVGNRWKMFGMVENGNRYHFFDDLDMKK